jgi:hypothetical protein
MTMLNYSNSQLLAVGELGERRATGQGQRKGSQQEPLRSEGGSQGKGREIGLDRSVHRSAYVRVVPLVPECEVPVREGCGKQQWQWQWQLAELVEHEGPALM